MGGYVKEIQKENKMLIECKTEQEQMICEQVLRTLRSEASQVKYIDGWKDITIDSQDSLSVSIHCEYRAKPKKELVVPWEWLEPCIAQVTVDDNKVVRVWDNDDEEYYRLPLNLDLTDIELPVTVKRPDSK